MYWQVMLVSDHELTNDWLLAEVDGDYIVFARESAVDADPARITVEVMEQLRREDCPARPQPIHAA